MNQRGNDLMFYSLFYGLTKITPYIVTKESPFLLASRMNAMVLAKLNMPSARVNLIDSKQKSLLTKEELDYLEEWRMNTLLRLEDYQRKSTRHYKAKKVYIRGTGTQKVILRHSKSQHWQAQT